MKWGNTSKHGNAQIPTKLTKQNKRNNYVEREAWRVGDAGSRVERTTRGRRTLKDIDTKTH